MTHVSGSGFSLVGSAANIIGGVVINIILSINLFYIAQFMLCNTKEGRKEGRNLFIRYKYKT